MFLLLSVRLLVCLFACWSVCVQNNFWNMTFLYIRTRTRNRRLKFGGDSWESERGVAIAQDILLLLVITSAFLIQCHPCHCSVLRNTPAKFQIS